MSSAIIRPRLPGILPDWEPVLDLLRSMGAPDALRKLTEWDTLPKSTIEANLRIRAARAEARDAREYAAALAVEAERTRRELDAALAVREEVRCSRITIRPQGSKRGKRAVVPILLLGDWHVAEIVERAAVNGCNESNPEIMERRVANIARAAVAVIRQTREWARVDEMLIHLQGDFVTGYIHPELAETNAMAPIEEARFGKRLIAGVLDYLTEHSGVKRFTVVCSRGNHGRLTKKKQFKNAAGTNLETSIYWDLADRYTEKDGWTWRIPPSGLAYVSLRNPDGSEWVVRGYHGEQCRYGGGVGGMTIPLNKLQARWDKTHRADFNLMGHYHTFSRPNPSTICNGSLKGTDEYAMENGFSHEPPIQTLAIYDPRWRMVSVVHPLFADR